MSEELRPYRVIVVSREGIRDVYPFEDAGGAAEFFRDALRLMRAPYRVFSARLEERGPAGSWAVRSTARPSKDATAARTAAFTGSSASRGGSHGALTTQGPLTPSLTRSRGRVTPRPGSTEIR